MAITGAQYAAEAAKLLGRDIPYVPGGSSLSGMDCDGLLRYIEKQLGLPLPDKHGTNYRWRNGLISEKGSISDCTLRWGCVPLGTIICIRLNDGGEKKHGYTDDFNIDHVYVKIEGGLVHASQSNGKVVFREFSDKEIPNGGPNAYCMRGDVVYSGKRVPSDVAGAEYPEVPELPEEEYLQESYAPSSVQAHVKIFAANGDPVRIREKPDAKIHKAGYEAPVGTILQKTGSKLIKGKTYFKVLFRGKERLVDSDFAMPCDAQGNLL